jgi:hypothetical protein
MRVLIIATVLLLWTGIGHSEERGSHRDPFFSVTTLRPGVQKPVLMGCSRVAALREALFWELPIEATYAEAQAIAHVIFNRVQSEDYPNTICEVVYQGAKPGKIDGCQFSFACDGADEHPLTLCRLHPKDTTARGGPRYCIWRWVKYWAIATSLLYDKAQDPTCGATHYFAAWMKKKKLPYWYKDLERASIVQIGSHVFARSRKVGLDVPRCGTSNTLLASISQRVEAIKPLPPEPGSIESYWPPARMK